jgi:hypothetical protein
MAKILFIPDPRFAADEKRAFDEHRQIREDESMTHRKPYRRSMKLDCQDID